MDMQMQLASMVLRLEATIYEVNALRQWRLAVPVTPPGGVIPGAGI